MSKHLTPAKRRARDRAIYARFLRGVSLDELVDEFDTTPPVIKRAVERGAQEAAARFADAERMRLLQTEQLELIFRESLVAWEESKKGHEITKVSSAGGADADRRKAEKVTRKQAGDPRFLSQATSALADLRRLWRLEAPAAVNADHSDTHDTLTLEEDARWYGNNAHDLAAQAVAASTADFAVSCTVQGRGLR
jgi:hypothetical protein